MNALRDAFALFHRDFGLALRRFTRLGPPHPQPDAAGGPAGPLLLHLPGVGWLVGVTACLVFAVVSLPLRENPWSALVAAVASTVATVLLTGALHETALYRAAERVEPGRSRAATASGLGTLCLLLVVGGKLVLLAALAAASEAAVMAALFAGHVGSRFLPVAVAHWTTPAEVDRGALGTAALWTLVPLLLLVPAGGVALLACAVLGAALAALALLRFLRRRGAALDDTVAGTLQQVTELGLYFGAALAVA